MNTFSKTEVYKLKNPVRIISSTSLFDGHDVAINIFRRILQTSGAELIHLGHDRSAEAIVEAALQENANAIAVSSYQGGHMEFFKYIIDLLKEKNATHIKVFGGGGGVILPKEIKELETYGVAKIYSPEHGQKLGLQGIINDLLQRCDVDTSCELIKNIKVADLALIKKSLKSKNGKHPYQNLAIALTALENGHLASATLNPEKEAKNSKSIVIGITGTGGAGKSTLLDELINRFTRYLPDKKIAVFCIDPTKRKTGGALLGDRIRMNAIKNENIFLRSFATRKHGASVNDIIKEASLLAKASGFDVIFLETSGIGQADSQIVDLSDLSIYVMTSEFGSPLQLEKIDMIDYADFIVINKFERNGSKDAIRDVRKQYKRSHEMFDPKVKDEDLPIFGTIASRFNDTGVNAFFAGLTKKLNFSPDLRDLKMTIESTAESIISQDRIAYLKDISQTIRRYKEKTKEQKALLEKRSALKTTQSLIKDDSIKNLLTEISKNIEKETENDVTLYDDLSGKYKEEFLKYFVRDKEFCLPLWGKTLSGTNIPKVAPPPYTQASEKLDFMRRENFAGFFPFTSGVFPLKRKWEEPKRQFAGEGTPETTNRRFHFLTKNEPAKRLSTAFDSITLYGQDPDERPDIFGKIGESGVSICTLDDMKKLYSGFDLTDSNTSVSMTVNGPAPIMQAFFFNTAIDQNIQKFEKEKGRKPNPSELNEIKTKTLSTVRGTIQADILKEDQAQNTCIFSLDFALKLMGDLQEYFVNNNIKNFYSISISGYHIAEAGANPISQLAFTLANGFTYVEYFLSRGIPIDKFAPNLSFFFSNGMDAEYSVIGRVARRIWAIAIRDLYKGNERSQKLKYHIQTSGRSLHAQEMTFNDIRTTLQALTAIFDNCNSLHTNSFDEAVTTPTEQAVRQAMAIQLIVNREFGIMANENPLQGAYIIDYLTDIVEEAVLKEFESISSRGGVLGAIETQYQRGKIQDESIFYESQKNSGEYPIIGVNTFLNPNPENEKSRIDNMLLSRATYEDKKNQIENLRKFQSKNKIEAVAALKALKNVALNGENIFEELINTTRVCSLGQITNALFEVGGEYRRNV